MQENTTATTTSPDTSAVSEVPEKKELTLSEFKKLRGQFFTVRHQIVELCGHKFHPTNPPRHANCEACWFAFFQVHGELTQSLDEAYQEHGIGLVEKLQGKRVAKMFLRFMSTLAAMQQEANERSTETVGDSGGTGEGNTPSVAGTEDNGGTLEGDSGGREGSEQGI